MNIIPNTARINLAVDSFLASIGEYFVENNFALIYNLFSVPTKECYEN